jgi:hypothetical protein
MDRTPVQWMNKVPLPGDFHIISSNRSGIG